MSIGTSGGTSASDRYAGTLSPAKDRETMSHWP